MKLSPIALFVYNRPWHTQQTVEALQKNSLADQSDLFIFSDAPKNHQDSDKVQKVRGYIKTIIGFKSLTIIEREQNFGLAKSILSGVTEIVNTYGRIIVLEDDLVSSPGFLDFMNKSLEKYKSDNNVACISGYVYPLKKIFKEAFFIKGADCWGWATWRDQWAKLNTEPADLKSKIIARKSEAEFNFNNSYPFMQMLEDKKLGKNQSWAILWYATAFINNQLCLYPPHSLVHNIGHDGSGTHTTAIFSQFAIDLKNKTEIIYASEISESKKGRKQFEFFYNSSKPLLINKIKNKIKRIYKRIFPDDITHGWFGNYSNWKDAEKQCTGYDSGAILEKVKTSLLKVKNGEAVYERDSVLFDEIQYSQPLLDAFRSIAIENQQALHVVDFGGSLGSSYFQNRNLLNDVKSLKWSIIEQKHFIDCGKISFEDDELKFYYTIDEALKREKSKVLLLSSVIQYFENPFELIEKCLSYDFDYIIIDRTAFIYSQKDRITVQIVPEYIYKASYAAWFFNEKKFLNAFTNRYKILYDFVSEESRPMKIDKDTQAYWKGFILKRNDE